MSERVSVLICTMNRPSELRRCLESLQTSKTPIAQTVVSDDSSESSTREIVCGKFPWVHYIEGPRRGLGANRNRALSAATGDYILFLDDDACLGPDFLQRVLRLANTQLASGKENMVISGAENNRGTIVYAHEQNLLGFQVVPYQGEVPRKTIVINSTLFPRRLFGRVRFDERLVYGYDEVDIAAQAVRVGYEILHCDSAVNFHYPSTINRSLYRPHTDASRLYVTFRRYAIYEKRYARAIAFAVLAPLHIILATLKRKGLRGIPDACRAIATAVRLALESVQPLPPAP